MRILLGATEIAGQIPIYADAFRRLGCQVTTAVVQRHEYWPVQYDVDFSGMEFSNNQALLAGYLFGSHDLFIYQWVRNGLLPDFADLPFLHQLGKKVVCVCVGSDVRNYCAYKKWFNDLQEQFKSWQVPVESMVPALQATRHIELYSSLILSQPNQSLFALRPYKHFFVPINLAQHEFRIPARDIPKILHVPSRRGLKGTQYFLEALDVLKGEGFQFELKFLENIPHQEMLRELSDADILLDELFMPLHGMATCEALASGCVVVTGDREDIEPRPENRPLWKATIPTLVDDLRRLLQEKNKRIALAEQGRGYVDQYHNHVKVARDILLAIQDPLQGPMDHFPTYFANDYQLPESEVIPQQLKEASSKIMSAYGIPNGASLESMAARGLI